jgi:hypothetical protein
MAYKAPKPTAAQLSQAKARAAASGINMNQSAKGLRNAGKAIIAASAALPAGRAVKAVRAVGGITGAGAKQVNPLYRNTTDAIQKRSVKVKQSEKQREAALRAEHEADLKSYRQQQSDEMYQHQSSGENFSKVKKINSNPMRGK